MGPDLQKRRAASRLRKGWCWRVHPTTAPFLVGVGSKTITNTSRHGRVRLRRGRGCAGGGGSGPWHRRSSFCDGFDGVKPRAPRRVDCARNRREAGCRAPSTGVGGALVGSHTPIERGSLSSSESFRQRERLPFWELGTGVGASCASRLRAPDVHQRRLSCVGCRCCDGHTRSV